MRGYIPDYRLSTPKNLKDALERLADGEKPFAGGTDLMVLLEAGQLPPDRYVSLWGLKALAGITVDEDSVTLGALTTYSEVRENRVLEKEFPLLCRAAELTGAVAIQNRGTLGGNIANASPAADTPPALLAYEAELELVSVEGTRVLPYDQFHLGYKKTALAKGEIIARVRLPRKFKGATHYYRKVGTRLAQSISKVVLVGIAKKKKGVLEGVRIAVGSVAPIPLRLFRTEALLEGARLGDDLLAPARAQLAGEITPIDDIRSTAVYRRKVAGNLLTQFLEEL